MDPSYTVSTLVTNMAKTFQNRELEINMKKDEEVMVDN